MSLIFNNLFILWVCWLLYVDINFVEFCLNGVFLGYSFLIVDYIYGILWLLVVNFIGRIGVYSNIKGFDVFNIVIKLLNIIWFGWCVVVVEILLIIVVFYIINYIGFGVLLFLDMFELVVLVLKVIVCWRILYCFDVL